MDIGQMNQAKQVGAGLPAGNDSVNTTLVRNSRISCNATSIFTGVEVNGVPGSI
jgi:hypothetical protein